MTRNLHVQAIHKASNKYTSLTLNLRAHSSLYVPLFQIIFFKYIIHVLRTILPMNSHHFPIAMHAGDFYNENKDAVFSVCLELQFGTYTICIIFRLKDLKHNLVTPSCSTPRTQAQNTGTKSPQHPLTFHGNSFHLIIYIHCKLMRPFFEDLCVSFSLIQAPQMVWIKFSLHEHKKTRFSLRCAQPRNGVEQTAWICV